MSGSVSVMSLNESTAGAFTGASAVKKAHARLAPLYIAYAIDPGQLRRAATRGMSHA